VPECTLIRHHKRCRFILTAGRWPWKSEPAKECVTTHLPNEPALKMDGAQACHPYPAVGAGSRPRRVGVRGGPVTKPRERSRVERPPVQILVVVANTQTGTLRAEVGKGSL
jgi:hypothetical protein